MKNEQEGSVTDFFMNMNNLLYICVCVCVSVFIYLAVLGFSCDLQILGCGSSSQSKD